MRRAKDFLRHHIPTLFGLVAVAHLIPAIRYAHALPAVALGFGSVGAIWAGLSLWWWLEDRGTDG